MPSCEAFRQEVCNENATLVRFVGLVSVLQSAWATLATPFHAAVSTVAACNAQSWHVSIADRANETNA